MPLFFVFLRPSEPPLPYDLPEKRRLRKAKSVPSASPASERIAPKKKSSNCGQVKTPVVLIHAASNVT